VFSVVIFFGLIGCVSFAHRSVESERPASEFTSVRGRRIHVVDSGRPGKRSVLFIHGYGASSASWRELADELGAGGTGELRLLAPDLPGFGLSDRTAGDYSPETLAEDLIALLDARGIGRVSVVGHSWGASIALALALRHPERVEKLVLMSAFCYADQLGPFHEWTQVPGLGELVMALFYRSNTAAKLALDFQDPDRFVTEERVERVDENLDRPGALAALLAAARGMAHFAELERHYGELGVPTLVLWGREDRVARLRFGERLARELPHARLVVIGECGHIPEIECMRPTARALADFLR